MDSAAQNNATRTSKGAVVWLFLALVFLLLFSSFRWNIFGIEKEQSAYNIGVDEYLIPTMEMYAAGPRLQRNLAEMQIVDDDGTHYPYVMQAGLQRMVYSWISPHTAAGVDRAIPYLRSLIAAALALSFAGFIFAVAREFGYLRAGIATVLLALSNWLIVFAPDLFWASALFFIPFTLAWLLGDPARPAKQQRLLAILFTLFCLVKCLCGFDYITNVCAAVAVPFVYFGLCRGLPLRKVAFRILRYGALSVAAFCSAIGLQIAQMTFVEKIPRNGLTAFFAEARRRTLSNGEGLGAGYDRAVLSLLHRLHFTAGNDATIAPWLVPLRPLLRYLRYLSMGAVTIPLPVHSLTIPIGVFVLGFVLVFWLRRKRLRRAAVNPARVTAWMWATLTALFVSHIWIVAANGHMTHTIFNAIVFYIPFLPMVYVLVAIALTPARSRAQSLSVPQKYNPTTDA